MPSDVLRHVIESITPASQAQAEAARRRVAPAHAPLLERLAAALGAAQHRARVRHAHRTVVVVAGDHGAGDPGIALGAAHPTVVAAQAIADGTAALTHVARTGRASIVLVDAGTTEAAHMPDIAVRVTGRPSRHLLHEPAMTIADATCGVEAGIALAVSLVDAGLDLLCVGSLGIGADLSATALLAAARGAPDITNPPGRRAAARGAPDVTHPPGRLAAARAAPDTMPAPGRRAAGAPDGLILSSPSSPSSSRSSPPSPSSPSSNVDIEAAARRGEALAGAPGLEQLAVLGGPDTAVLSGLLLGAASMNVPVLLDGHATGAAALVASALAPHVVGYLIAAHAGTLSGRSHAADSSSLQPRILAHLGLVPIFDVGLGLGEGIGAAMVLPLVDQVAALGASGYNPLDG